MRRLAAPISALDGLMSFEHDGSWRNLFVVENVVVCFVVTCEMRLFWLAVGGTAALGLAPDR